MKNFMLGCVATIVVLGAIMAAFALMREEKGRPELPEEPCVYVKGHTVLTEMHLVARPLNGCTRLLMQEKLLKLREMWESRGYAVRVDREYWGTDGSVTFDVTLRKVKDVPAPPDEQADEARFSI